jgi:hypothetical protein
MLGFFFLQKAKNESLAYLTGYTWIRNATSNITFDLYIDNDDYCGYMSDDDDRLVVHSLVI